MQSFDTSKSAPLSAPLIEQVGRLIPQLEEQDSEASLQTLGCDLVTACHGRMIEIEQNDRLDAIHHAVAGAQLIQALRRHQLQQPDWMDIHEEQLCRYGGLWIHDHLHASDRDLHASETSDLATQGLFLLRRLNEIHNGSHSWIHHHLDTLETLEKALPQAAASPGINRPQELTIVVAGNCQAWPIYLYLQQWCPNLRCHHGPSVHMATPEQVADFQQLVAHADVLLMHRIQPGYRDDIGLDNRSLAGCLSPGARLLVLPSLHYEGHHPWIGYALDPDGLLASLETSSPLGPYHDFLAMAAAGQGLSAEDLLSRSVPPELAGLILQNHQQSLEQLRLREADCDVEISSWIDQHHRQVAIAHTINHPTRAVLAQLLLRVLADLSLGTTFQTDALEAHEHLGELSIPILPWVRDVLELGAWAQTCGHRNHSEPFAIEAQLAASIAFYRQHPWIASVNQNHQKFRFAQEALELLLQASLAPTSTARAPSVAALINYFDDIDMLRWQLRGGFLDSYDRIYIWDGPYNYLASIPIFPQHPRRLDETELGRELLSDSLVTYCYKEWNGEAEKRIAAYEAVQEDIVVLHDTDEFATIPADQHLRFWTSTYDVASNSVQNLYLNGLHCTSNPGLTPTLDNLPLKRIAFKRAKVSASDHLNFLWLVGVEQQQVNPERIDPQPLSHAYHFTACRSQLGQETKMGFYTALYFSDKPTSWEINKLAELVNTGVLSDIQARRIFLQGNPGYAGIPYVESDLTVYQRITDPGVPQDLVEAILAERNRVGTGSHLLLPNYPLQLWLEAPVESIQITLSQAAKLTVRSWDWINGNKAQEQPTVITHSSTLRIEIRSPSTDLHGRHLSLMVEPDDSLPPVLTVEVATT